MSHQIQHRHAKQDEAKEGDGRCEDNESRGRRHRRIDQAVHTDADDEHALAADRLLSGEGAQDDEELESGEGASSAPAAFSSSTTASAPG